MPEPAPAPQPDLTPLEGGFSGETFLSEYAGERAVVRIYAGRGASRGPLAPEIDAAVLGMVVDLLPVPVVLEARAADPGAGAPGMLVIEFLPGVRLDLVLPGLDEEDLARVGAHLGRLLARLGHIAQARAGEFVDTSLSPTPFPPQLRDLAAWVDHHREALSSAGLGPGQLEALDELVDGAQDLLDLDRRSCLVHGDFNPKNLLVDPDSLEVTGLLDWEFAHSGHPWADLGNLTRFERRPAFVAGVRNGLEELLPRVPDDALSRAAAADLFALVELGSRAGENPVADAAVERLRELVGSDAPAL